ncbi:Sec-independent protein translocase protein TatB [Solemya velesiana gill symbiont]|uniref:Sec-independent protein translocase protein TatB n=1 Tax=Solemya velesiana gill symbiont TaxID=1918948 RepID=A0A1T2KU32_9GAMM|nr:Sec-independent protein translocase protein TatB [Solemya velesiana gill symbiont]OOZ36334.1 twin arginine-targeting protein translocase TatB [Solemya velesiana gill symbiont]
MFDVGFFELLILGLVALLVVGPERLPKLAHTAGKWLGKGRSMISSVKADIDKEIKAEELKQVLEEQKKKMNPLEEVIEETSSTMQDLKNETESTVRDAQNTLGDSKPASTDTTNDSEQRSGG